MLFAADANLIARDRDLPGLRLLLDTELFLEMLQQQLPDVSFESVQATYLRYKPGMNCLAAYQVIANGMSFDVHAKAYKPSEQAKLLKSNKKEILNPILDAGVLVLGESGIAVSFYPNDKKLRSLRRLNSLEQRRTGFQKMFENQPDLWSSDCEKLNYKPERRYVAKLQVRGEPLAVLRCYTESDFYAVRPNAKIFHSSERVRVPRKIAHSKQNFWIAYEWMEGTSLDSQQTSPEVFRYVGTALAELHTNKPQDIAHLTREKIIKQLIDQVDDLSLLYPDLERNLRRTAGKLAALLLKQPLDSAPTHGDFNASQVVMQPHDVVAILDLDEAVFSDTAVDPGNFIAHLERDALLGKLPQELASQITEAFLEGYRSARNPLQHVELYAAIGLFKLISEPFRFRNRDWFAYGKAILDRIQSMVSEFVSSRTQQVFFIVKSEQPHQIPVIDPFGVLVDKKMPFLAEALSPLEMQFQFGKYLPFSRAHLQSIRVTRYKPERRCLVEYEIQADREPVTLIGKVRAKGLDRVAIDVLEALYHRNFGSESVDRISVPQTMGVIPALRMYLQRKVKGVPASEWFRKGAPDHDAARIADAICKLHQAGVPVSRNHTIEDELRILHERLAFVSERLPHLTKRIEELLRGCEVLADTVSGDSVCGIHRDFYPDQVLFSGDRIFLLDFDSYCAGDPALDAGNFLAHVIEQSLREFGTSESWIGYEQAFQTRFQQLTRSNVSDSVEAYTLLSLVRHIYLSTQFADRSFLTEQLLDLCEYRMASLRVSAGRSS